MARLVVNSFPLIEIDSASATCRIETIKLPAVGFGTYPLTDQMCTDAVEEALEAGYRIIDTATRYNNFKAIAKACKKYNRKDIYIISKVWHDNLMPVDVRKDLNWTLEQLETEYLDAYLVHWPNSAVPIGKTLSAMEELRRSKKIRHIGLSNVTVNHLKKALKVGVTINWVQIEMHPFFYDEELLKFCQRQGIGVQAWSPLGRGRIDDDLLLMRMSQRYGKTPAQIALRWIIQHSSLPLPSSKNKMHIRENKNIADFLLSDEEMKEINQRARSGTRKRLMKEKAGFADEFDFSYDECWPS